MKQKSISKLKAKRGNKEYFVCKQIAQYLRVRYPKVLFHFDLSGLNLSRAQAGMTKMIQNGRGWPDLFLAESRNGYHGFFIEVKAEGTKLYKVKDGSPATPHIGEQGDMMHQLDLRGYAIGFAVGFDEAKVMIDNYLL